MVSYKRFPFVPPYGLALHPPLFDLKIEWKSLCSMFRSYFACDGADFGALCWMGSVIWWSMPGPDCTRSAPESAWFPSSPCYHIMLYRYRCSRVKCFSFFSSSLLHTRTIQAYTCEQISGTSESVEYEIQSRCLETNLHSLGLMTQGTRDPVAFRINPWIQWKPPPGSFADSWND